MADWLLCQEAISFCAVQFENESGLFITIPRYHFGFWFGFCPGWLAGSLYSFPGVAIEQNNTEWVV